MSYETDLREQTLEAFLRGLVVDAGVMVAKPTRITLENIWAQGTTPDGGLALLLNAPTKRKKRTSRRRWKARIRLGQWVPWWAVIDHDLREWNPLRGARDWPSYLPVPDLPLWDREHDTQRARSALILFRTQMELRALRLWQSVIDDT